jgi:hypothetical protein
MAMAPREPKEILLELVQKLSPVRQYELLDFARFLCWLEQQEKEEREDWHRFGLEQFNKAFGPDETEYTEADIKPELNP